MENENRLQRVNRTLRAIQRVNQAILHIRRDPKRLLREVCRILAQERGYETVWIAELREERLYPTVAFNNTDDDAEPLKTWASAAPYDQSAAQRAIVTGAPAIEAGRSDERAPRAPQPPADWITAAVPVQVDGETHAVINACSCDPTSFDEKEIQLLQELAADVGLALENIEAESRRWQAEEALRISEERFRRLSENAPIGIVLIQNGRFRYVNPAFAEMFGYANPGAMIDRRGPADVAVPEDRARVQEQIARNLTSNQRAITYTFTGQRSDGSTIEVEVHGARTIHARRPAVIATVIDITAWELSRRQLEALSEAGLVLSRARDPQDALQKAAAEALNITAGDAANVFLLGDDPTLLASHGQPLAPSGKLQGDAHTWIQQDNSILSRPTAQHMLHTRAPLLIQDTAQSELWTPKTNDAVRAYLGTPLIVRQEVIGFLNVDGRQPGQFNETDAHRLRLFADYVAATIENLRLIHSLEDERRRLITINALSQTLAETLDMQEVAHRALAHVRGALSGVRHATIYLWYKDQAQFKPLAGDGQAMPCPPGGKPDVVGWLAQQIPEAQHQQITDLALEIHGELIGMLLLHSKDPLSESDYQLLETLRVPIALALQNARYFESAAHQARAMALALQRQEELDRMKDELIQNISHELRTPLALVMGYAQMLHEGALGEVPETQAEAVEIIARRSQMLRSLVENITLLWQLECNRATEDKEAETLDLARITGIVTSEFHPQAEDLRIHLSTQMPEEPLKIRGIALQIHRVLDNLIGNALKFTPTEGHINVVVKREGSEAVLSVCDDGIGVPPDELEHIFERFYQVDGSAKRRYGGVGLGLALVKTIVESHGGKITARSPIHDDEAQPGTCLVVRLPLVQDF